MTPMQPEQAAFLRDQLLNSLRMEHPTTRRVVEAIPVDQASYRPDEVGRRAIDLAWHIVGAEHLFMEAVVNGVFDFTNSGRPATLTNTAEIARWYGETFAQDAAKVGALDADRLLRVVDFRGLFRLPAVAFLQFSMSHIIHHRGQLSMYLRPMGAKVPAIYGESYDSAKAKEAK